MTKGIRKGEPDARIAYADIIDRPRWQSPTRPRMSLYDRAAQFAAYKALSGYEDMVAEEARLTEEEMNLGEEELDLLNRKLSLIARTTETGEHPLLTFTVFIPDQRKAGGRYEEITDRVYRVDLSHQKVILQGASGRGKQRVALDLERIAAIHGDIIDHLDE